MFPPYTRTSRSNPAMLEPYKFHDVPFITKP